MFGKLRDNDNWVFFWSLLVGFSGFGNYMDWPFWVTLPMLGFALLTFPRFETANAEQSPTLPAYCWAWLVSS